LPHLHLLQVSIRDDWFPSPLTAFIKADKAYMQLIDCSINFVFLYLHQGNIVPSTFHNKIRL
jgi:hypothetical protein